jgi:tetratricopeptide (TPR) repeat protein
MPIRLLLLLAFLWVPTIYKATSIQHVENILTTYPDSALRILNDNLPKIDENNFEELAKSNYLMGKIFYNSGLFYKSMILFQNAENYIKKTKNHALYAEIKVAASKTAYYLNQIDLAFKQLTEAEKYLIQHQQTIELADIYSALGRLYEKKLNYKQSIILQIKALQIYTSQNNKNGIALVYNSIGTIYEDLNKHDSAFYYFVKAAKINEVLQNYDELVININNIGDSYRKRNLLDSAIYYSTKALELAKQKNFTYQESTALRDLAKINVLKQNFSAAYEFETESRKVYEEVYNRDLNEQVALMQTLYEVEEQKSVIKNLEDAKKLQRNVNWAIIITVFSILIAVILFFSKKRSDWKISQKLLENQKKIAENEKEILQSEESRLQLELKHKKLEEQFLNSEYYSLQKELLARMMQNIEKDKLLENLKAELKEIQLNPKENLDFKLKMSIKKINDTLNDNYIWDDFIKYFEGLNHDFIQKIKFIAPDITSSELKLCILIKQNLQSDKIASILNINKESLRVSKYRLKKKLKINSEESLTNFLLSIK